MSRNAGMEGKVMDNIGDVFTKDKFRGGEGTSGCTMEEKNLSNEKLSGNALPNLLNYANITLSESIPSTLPLKTEAVDVIKFETLKGEEGKLDNINMCSGRDEFSNCEKNIITQLENDQTITTNISSTENIYIENSNIENFNSENLTTENFNTEILNTENFSTENFNTENLSTENTNVHENISNENIYRENISNENINEANRMEKDDTKLLRNSVYSILPTFPASNEVLALQNMNMGGSDIETMNMNTLSETINKAETRNCKVASPTEITETVDICPSMETVATDSVDEICNSNFTTSQPQRQLNNSGILQGMRDLGKSYASESVQPKSGYSDFQQLFESLTSKKSFENLLPNLSTQQLTQSPSHENFTNNFLNNQLNPLQQLYSLSSLNQLNSLNNLNALGALSGMSTLQTMNNNMSTLGMNFNKYNENMGEVEASYHLNLLNQFQNSTNHNKSDILSSVNSDVLPMILAANNAYGNIDISKGENSHSTNDIYANFCNTKVPSTHDLEKMTSLPIFKNTLIGTKNENDLMNAVANFLPSENGKSNSNSFDSLQHCFNLNGNNIQTELDIMNGDAGSCDSNFSEKKILKSGFKDDKKKKFSQAKRSSRAAKNANSAMTVRSTIPGVVFDKSGNKWTARWNMGGRQFKKTFAASKYGYDEARNLAEQCRMKAMSLLGNEETFPYALDPNANIHTPNTMQQDKDETSDNFHFGITDNNNGLDSNNINENPAESKQNATA